MKHRKLFAFFLIAVMLLGLLAGCKSNIKGEFISGGDGAPDKAPADSDHLAGVEIIGIEGAPSQKLIRNVRMDAETEDMDNLLAQLNARIAQLGGYVESRDVYNGGAGSSRNRYASMTIRIPVEVMDQFVEQVSEAANIVSSTESAEDVTLSYIATQSRLTALETEEVRLLELLTEAKGLDELLIIESRLTEVREELEKVTSQLRLYDNLVDYGTIKLYLQEVKTYTVAPVEEKTTWQRITNGFSESMENLGTAMTYLLVVFVTGLPYLIPLAVIALIVLLAIKLTNRKKRRGAKPKAPEQKES